MRPLFITLFLAFLSLTAGDPQLLSRHDRKRFPIPSVFSSRQFHVPRSLLDLCINLNLNLFADVSQLLDLESILGPLDLLAEVHLCLCLKDLDIYLDTDSEIQSLIQLVGADVIGSRIHAIINTSPYARKCTFPPHAHHTCYTKDPCHWACDENYVRDGDKCVCAPPFISCNGICGLFPKGCSSALSRSLNARTQSILTLSQAKATCKRHETVCGIDGRENSLAFECIDTTSTTDSCGGCMAPHPFRRNVKPLHEISGQDCTRIPNVRNVGCSHSRCFIASCQEGWIPNANNSVCILDLAVLKRSDSLSINVTANTVVDPEVLTKLVAIVDTVLHLGLPPSVSGANVTTSILYGVSLLNDANTATANLVTSRTIGTFLKNIDHLIDISSLLKSWLSSCACVNGFGLSELVEEINSLLSAVAELRTFCSSHPIVSGPESYSTVTVLSPSATFLPDHPLLIRPSDISAGLLLNSEVDATINGLLDTNKVLNALGLGLDDHHTPTSNIDSDLLNQIIALAHLAIDMQNRPTGLPLVGDSASIDANLLAIGRVTKNLLSATTVSDIVTSLELLVALSNVSVQILENCGCIDSLGVQQLHSNLNHMLGVALEARTWCRSHPVVPGSSMLPLVNTTGDDVAVVVGLSDLLNSLSLGLLQPIKVSTTLDGLGEGLGNTANSLLASVGIDPNNAKRGVIDDINERGIVNLDLLSCLEVLVNLVAQLQTSMSLALPTQPSIGSAELSLVKEMVDALACITPSTAIPTMRISVNKILVAESSLRKTLQTCSDAGMIKDLMDKITKVTLRLGDICGSSGTTLVHHSTTLLPTSRLVSAATIEGVDVEWYQ